MRRPKGWALLGPVPNGPDPLAGRGPRALARHRPVLLPLSGRAIARGRPILRALEAHEAQKSICQWTRAGAKTLAYLSYALLTQEWSHMGRGP